MSAREILAAGNAATTDWEARWRFTYAKAIAFAEENEENGRLRAQVERLKARLARDLEDKRRRQLRGRAWWCPSTDMERAASALRAAHISAMKPKNVQRERAWRENWTYWMGKSKAHRLAAHAAGQGVPR